MGVRGDVVETPMEWIGDDDVFGLINIGNEELYEKKYEKALSIFNEALGWTEIESEKQTINYHIALSYSMSGKDAVAGKYLAKTKLEPENELYYKYILLKGDLSLKKLAFAETLDIFNEFLASGYQAQPPELQTIYYLQSVCYDNLKNPDAKKQSLQKAYNEDSGSEIGIAAGKMLKGL